MKKRKTEPFEPCVTMEEVFAFDPEREETWTRSPLMNAVLTAVKREKITQQADVAKYMEVNYLHLGGAVKIIMGMTFNQMRDQLLRHIVGRLREEHPDWRSGELARAIGYSDHSALWRLFHREHDHRYYKEWSDRRMERQRQWELEIRRKWKEEHGGGQ